MWKIAPTDILDLLPEKLQNRSWRVGDYDVIYSVDIVQFILNLWYGEPAHQGICAQRSNRKFDRLVALAKRHDIAFFEKGQWKLREPLKEELRELEAK